MAKRREAVRIYIGREDMDLGVKWSQDGTPNLMWPVAPKVDGLLCLVIDMGEEVVTPAVYMAGESGPGVTNLEELRMVLKPWCAFVRAACRGLGLPPGRWQMKFEPMEWRCCYSMRCGQMTPKNRDPDVDLRELSDKLLCLAHVLYGYRTGLEEASA